MKAEEYLAKFREDALKVVDDENDKIDFRCHVYFQHMGRIEAVFMTEQIGWKRFHEIIDEWKKHWPYATKKENRND